MEKKQYVKTLTIALSCLTLGLFLSSPLKELVTEKLIGAKETVAAATTAAASERAEAVNPVPTTTVAAAPTDIFCTPVQVLTFQNRLHVRCASAVGGILYFAVPTSNDDYADRVLSILATAQVAGRTLIIRYDPADTSGAAYGCQLNDCRPIQGVGFGQ